MVTGMVADLTAAGHPEIKRLSQMRIVLNWRGIRELVNPGNPTRLAQ